MRGFSNKGNHSDFCIVHCFFIWCKTFFQRKRKKWTDFPGKGGFRFPLRQVGTQNHKSTESGIPLLHKICPLFTLGKKAWFHVLIPFFSYIPVWVYCIVWTLMKVGFGSTSSPWLFNLKYLMPQPYILYVYKFVKWITNFQLPLLKIGAWILLLINSNHSNDKELCSWLATSHVTQLS